MDFAINKRPLLEEEEEDEYSDSGHGSPGPSTCSPARGEHGKFGFPKGSEPRDWYRMGYLTFYLLGIVTLLPYTFFVTANEYWMYKLRDVTQNDTLSSNKTALQAEFTTYLTIAASGPAVFFMIVNSLLSNRISTQIRMFGSLIIILLSFIVTTVFVDVDTDSWQDLFFVITLAIVVLVNVFGAILAASLLGIACKFSSRYISAVVGGQALGGIFAALVYIGALAVGASSTHSALLYFSIANVTIIICLGSYYLLSRSLFFQYHMLITAPVNTLTYDPMEGSETETSPRLQVSVHDIFFKTWEYGVAGMLTFVVTLSVYPGVTVLVTSVNSPSLWTDKYFVPVITFLVFSSWDYIGRVVAGYLKWPLRRKWLILGFTVGRIAMIPIFLLCNAHPRANLPVLIYSDSIYVAATCIFGFTNGYLSNIVLINIPKIVESAEQEVASSIISTYVSVGCAVGALFSFIFVRLL